MDKRLVELESWGCDIEGAMRRLLDDEEFYFVCYEQVLEDDGFELLRKALEKHDIKHSFEYAHSLKGIIANLGLTSLYHIISEIVEPLRAGTDEGVMEKYQGLMQERERYRKLKICFIHVVWVRYSSIHVNYIYICK